MSRETATNRALQANNGGFAAALLDPDIDIPLGITNRQGQPAPRRYGVYRNNVVVGLMEAMRSAFPSVCAIVGDENFDRVARNFIVQYPPKSPMMQAYGTGFAEFIENFPPLRNLAFLADVARLERAFLDAAHAADAPCLDAAALAGVDAQKTMDLVFVRHSALHLVNSNHPLLSLFDWRHERPQSGPDMANAQSVMVTRPLLAVELRQVSGQQLEFLAALARGETLGAATNATLSCNPEFDLASTLALALAAGAFTAFSIR